MDPAAGKEAMEPSRTEEVPTGTAPTNKLCEVVTGKKNHLMKGAKGGMEHWPEECRCEKGTMEKAAQGALHQ